MSLLARMTEEGQSSGIHLLEVGLDWPPETFLQWRFERLATAGFRITVTSTVPAGTSCESLPGVRLVRMPSGSESRTRRWVDALIDGLLLLATEPSQLLRLAAGLRRTRPPPGLPDRWENVARLVPFYLRLARLEPDIVQFEWEQTAVACQPLFDVWDRPLVLSCHGILNIAPHGAIHSRWLTRLPDSLRSAEAICCASEPLKRKAIAHGADPAKAMVVHSAVDPDLFRPAGRARSERGVLRVIAVGLLWWVKGYEYSLAAVRMLVDSGIPVRFEILGGDPPAGMREAGERRRILLTIEDLGLHDHVHLHGEVGSAQVRRLLQDADLFLNSSVSEGVPTAVLEAMACGLPVVATDCGGVREAVTDGVEGIVVPSRDAEAMAAAMEKLGADPELRSRMGAAGRERVREEFALSQQVARIAGLYHQLQASDGRPSKAAAGEPA